MAPAPLPSTHHCDSSPLASHQHYVRTRFATRTRLRLVLTGEPRRGPRRVHCTRNDNRPDGGLRGGQRVRDRQYGPSQNATGSKRLQELLRTPRRLITAQKARSHRSKAEGAASLAVSQFLYNPPDQQAAWKPQPRWRPRPHEMQSRLFIHPLSEQMKPKMR